MKNIINKKWNNRSILFILILGAILASCNKDLEELPPIVKPPPTSSGNIVIEVTPSLTYQKMVGFGGALTWYGERVLTSDKTDEITQLLFEDLGMDILRLKNWYYPDNYPDEKGVEFMSNDNSAMLWGATNELYDLAKSRNPNIKVLLSSWGPPMSLKSNADTREGTLKKNDEGQFMYDEFAQYWRDALDYLPFNPDYISIQNEPGYVNSGWTTSEWAATETDNLPGYDIAFDKIYDKIKTQTNPPIMIGPETANIDNFNIFAQAIKNKSHLGMYAYHPYDINSNTSAEEAINKLQTLKSYTNKPIIMSEYSNGFSWFDTATFIHNVIKEGNASGYIYWQLAWGTPSSGNDNGMISINSAGEYIVTPFYYVMKHYAKHIDFGDRRINVNSTDYRVQSSAYINPSKNQITIVAINPSSNSAVIDLEVKSYGIKTIDVIQSKENQLYKNIDTITPGEPISLPSKSITTIVLGV